MATASDIVERLGGSAALARTTGFPLTTIEGWKQVNYIPAWRQPAIVDVAVRRDPPVALSFADFPVKAERLSRPAPEALAERAA